MSVFLLIHWSTVIASHCAAFLAVHGASTGTCFDISSILSWRIAASARISGSGGTVPVYLSFRPLAA